MDVLNTYTIALALGWFAGFFAGALTKCVSYRRAERRADAERIAQRVSGPLVVGDAAADAVARYRDRYRSTNVPAGSLGARLGAVSRDHDGNRVGAGAVGGDLRRADAEALT